MSEYPVPCPDPFDKLRTGLPKDVNGDACPELVEGNDILIVPSPLPVLRSPDAHRGVSKDWERKLFTGYYFLSP